MVRTRKSANYIISLGKSSKGVANKAACSVGPSTSSSASPTASSSLGKKYSGGNPVHPRPIPTWQKEITCFFPKQNEDEESSSMDMGDNVGLLESPPEQEMTQDQCQASSSTF